MAHSGLDRGNPLHDDGMATSHGPPPGKNLVAHVVAANPVRAQCGPMDHPIVRLRQLASDLIS